MEMTPRQFRAIALLYQGMSKAEIAAELKITPATLNRWTNDPDFKKATVDNAVQQIGQLVPQAVNTIQGVMTDPNSKPGDRLSAAKAVLEMAHVADKAVMDANVNLRVEYV